MGKMSDIRLQVLKDGILLPHRVNPYAMPEDEVPKFYNDGNCQFSCPCGVLYELRRGDHALIPVKRVTENAHADSCPLSERYFFNERAIWFDTATGTLAATVRGDITKRPVRRPYAADDRARIAPDGAHLSLSPFGLIRRVNLLALYFEYEKKRSSVLEPDSGRYFKYYLAENFSRSVYAAARMIEIPGQETRICDTSVYEDGYDFFYRPLSGIEATYWDREWKKHKVLYENSFSFDDLVGLFVKAGTDATDSFLMDRGKVFVRFIFSDGDVPPLKVSIPALKDALRHINACSTPGEIDLSKGTIVAAGWRYPDTDRNGNVRKNPSGKIYPIADRLALLNVNRYGVYTESLAELRLSEMVIRKVNRSPSLMYYKPFVMSDAFYHGKWIPKGILKDGVDGKPVVLEIYDSAKSSEYLGKSGSQDPEKHSYLTWFPSRETLEEFGGRLDDVLNG